MTETAVAAIAVGELLDNLESNLLDGHKDHLCDPFRRLYVVRF